MSRTVTVGVDGSPESLAAADWAAREALLRGAALRIVYAGEQEPHDYVPFAGEAVAPPGADRSVSMLREVRASLLPGVEVTEEAVIGRVGSHPVDASRDASLVVVGRRNRHVPVGGHIGPVTHAVLHDTAAPVAVVPHD